MRHIWKYLVTKYVGTKNISHFEELQIKVLFCFSYFIFLYGGVLPVCTSVYHMCVVPEEARRGCWVFWDWSYIWVVAGHTGAGSHSQVL